MTDASIQAVRLVCFDLGGVIVRICRTWRQACERAGLDTRGAKPDRDAVARIDETHAEHQSGRIDGATFARRISDVLAGALSPEEVMAAHRALIIDEYEGVAEVVDRLHESGIETACLSNTNPEHWSQVHRFPAIVKLGTRLVSHEMGLTKPDARIFRAAEARLGRRGRAILYFDDDADNVAAARAIGWRAAHVDHAGRTDEQILVSLAEHEVRLESGTTKTPARRRAGVDR